MNEAPQQARDEHGRPIYQIEPGTQLAAFLRSSAPVQIIQGPVGSGKSKVCNLKIAQIAFAQTPGPDGYRRIRVGVIRNTYPELRSTTIRTWLDTYPEEMHGRLIWSQPPRQIIRWGEAIIEVDFLALDKEDDIKKIRSGEYTLFYVNELQYLIKVLFDELTSRTGRFPAMKDGGPTWHGILADMNAPDEDHFIAMMTGQADYPENTPDEDKIALPADWEFFMQPPGLLETLGPDGRTIDGYVTNPAAENIKWLPKDYYLNLIKGKTRAFIKTRALNQLALVIDGEPVWPGFREDIHVARSVLQAVPGHDLYVGLDFGRSPAMVVGQQVNNRIVVLAELQAFNEGAVTFAPKVKRFLEQNFPGFKFRAFGDPKGADATQTDDRTAFDVFRFNGIPVQGPSNLKQNMIDTRVQAVERPLGELYDGRPRFLLSPRCRSLKVGMAGRYCYKRVVGADRTQREPDKNRYSHLADALQYMCLGMGEGLAMVGLTPGDMPKPARVAKRHSMRRVSA
jgi:hypothetical protein